MAKVLVAEDERDIRELVVETLVDGGHDVIEASDGGAAFDLACQESPDVILLDVMMPVLDGFEVLEKMRENPDTRATPVILLTAMPAALGEPVGMKLGVNHYITKPFDSEILEVAVRVALREAGIPSHEGIGGQTPVVWKGAGPHRGTSDASDAETTIGLGSGHLDRALGGGIPLGSLVLLAGSSSSGKSVLCQQFCYESVRMGLRVAYFTSDYTSKGFAAQMREMSLDVSDDLRKSELVMHPLEGPTPSGDTQQFDETESLMTSLATDIGRISENYQVIFVDAITDLAAYSDDKAIFRFFSFCRGLCKKGRTIIVAANSAALDEKLLVRLHDLCDGYLKLQVEMILGRPAGTLEVRKVRNAELDTENTASFTVAPGIGLESVPMSKVKA